jgi:hypothetical protein
MLPKDQLTHEYLKGIFKSNFDLTNCAIQLARYYIRSGHEVNVDELLMRVSQNPHAYEDELAAEREEREEERSASDE